MMRGLFKKFTFYVKPKNLAEIAERSRVAIEDTSATAVNIVKTRFVGPLPEGVSVSDKDVASAIGTIEAQKLAALGNIQNAYIGGVSRVKSANTRAGASVIAGIGAGIFGYYYFDKEKTEINRKNSELNSEMRKFMEEKYIQDLETKKGFAIGATTTRKDEITQDFLTKLKNEFSQKLSEPTRGELMKKIDSLREKQDTDFHIKLFRKASEDCQRELIQAGKFFASEQVASPELKIK